jgi:D-aminopeptidase
MVCLGFKGGIGSASRDVTPTGYRLGALVLANFGDGAALTVDGVPVGRDFVAEGWKAAREEPEGSCIVVLATDAPLSSRQLERLARRAGLGLARTGSVAHHGSGEIFVAFAPPGRRPRGDAPRADVPDSALNDVFEAVVDASEEAVLNALWAAPEVVGREGRVAHALPHDEVLELLGRYGRLG